MKGKGKIKNEKKKQRYNFNSFDNYNSTKLLVPRNGTNEIKRYNKLKIQKIPSIIYYVT